MSPCESQLPVAPVSISSMKRTPRSASRRAIEALPGEALGAAALETVELVRGVGFLGKVERFGRGRLACRTRSRRSGCARRVAASLSRASEMPAVEGGGEAEFHLLQRRHRRGGAGCSASARARARRACLDGSRAESPTTRPARRRTAERARGPRSGQIRIHRAEPVADPRADAGPGEADRAGVNAERRLRSDRRGRCASSGRGRGRRRTRRRAETAR